MNNLQNLLKPKSIAIIGASSDISKIGGRLHNNLVRHGYQGDVYLVNPKYSTIGNLKCHPRLSDIPPMVDVVLVAVPESAVFSVLEEAGKNKIKNAIVYSSGFSEVGEEGKSRQERLKGLAEEFRISVCGPNCVGIVNFHDNIAMSFSQFLNISTLIPGHIAFISQSGALGGSLLNRAQDKKIGFSYFVSTGNEAVLGSSDFMEYLVDDPNTRVIAALIEGVSNAEKFLEVSDLALKKNKPIVVMKIGKTKAGAKAASSHTGSMVGTDEVYDAIFKQKAIIRVNDLDDLYLTASVFVKSQLPKGNRIGILTSTGGGGVILTDKIIEGDMVVPDPSQKTTQSLRKVVPSFASVQNPFDLTAQLINDPLLFRKSIEVFAKDENFDAVIVATSMVASELSEKRASFIIKAAESIKKPIFTWWAAGSLSAPGMRMLEESQVPFFNTADQCVNAMRSLIQYSKFKKTYGKYSERVISISPQKKDRIGELLRSSHKSLTEDQGKEILSSYGIPVTSEGLGKNLREAKDIARNIGYPIALKIISPKITHKTEARGLRLNIKDEKELSVAYEEILGNVKKYHPKAEVRGVLVQEMVKPGKEVIIGVSQDPQFGPVVMFGIGGVFVEMLEDFSVRRAPLREKDAWEMIRETKGYRILEGVRGDKQSDLESIVKVLIAISQLALDFRNVISEIDINPLRVYPEGEGSKVVDCLFIKK
jgi:acetyltransferase